MIGRRLAILSASAALHLGGAGLVLMVAGVGAGSAILVDLVSDLTGDSSLSPRADTSPRRASAWADGPPRAHPPRLLGAGGPDRARAAPAPGDQRPVVEGSTPPARGPAPSVAPSLPPIAATPLPPASAGLTPDGADPHTDGARAVGPRASADRVAASPAGAGRPDLAAAPGPEQGSGSVTGVVAGGSPVALAAVGEGRGGLPPEYAP